MVPPLPPFLLESQHDDILNTFGGSLGHALGFHPREVLGNSHHVGAFPAQELVAWPAAEMSLGFCLHSSHPGGAGLLNTGDSS